MNHVVQVSSVECLFPDSGGVCFRIRARKPPELVVKQVRASFHGQEFWSALNKVFGTALAATFRLTLHPIFLCPDHLDPSHFKFGKDEAIFDVRFGAALGVGKLRLKKKSVMKRMKMFIQHGDPQLVIELDYGEKFLSWNKIGTLTSILLKFSEVVDAIDSGRTLYAVRSDAYVPISRPQSMIEDMSLKNRYRTRTQLAVHTSGHMLLTDDIHQLLPGSEDIRVKSEITAPITTPLKVLEKSSISNSMTDSLPISEKEAIINDSSLSPDEVRRGIGVITQVFPSATQHHSHVLPLLQEPSDSESNNSDQNSNSNSEDPKQKKFGAVLRTAADFKTKKEYEIWLLREILGVNSREISKSVSSSSSEDEKLEMKISVNVTTRQRALTFSHDSPSTELELEEVLEIQADISLQELRSRLISNLEDPFGLESDYSPITPISKQTPSKAPPSNSKSESNTPMSKTSTSKINVSENPLMDHPFAEELEEIKKEELRRVPTTPSTPMKSSEVETSPQENLAYQRSPPVGRSASESSVIVHKERSESTGEIPSDSENQNSSSSFVSVEEVATPSIEMKAEVPPPITETSTSTPLRKWKTQQKNFRTTEDISSFYVKPNANSNSNEPSKPEVVPSGDTVETFDKVLDYLEITDPVQRQKLTDLPLSKKALIIQQYHIKVKTDIARKRTSSIDEKGPTLDEVKKEKKSKKLSQQVIQGIGKGLRRFSVSGSSSSPGVASEKRKSTYLPSTSKPKKEEKLPTTTPPPLPPMNDLFKCSNCKQDLLPLAEKCDECGHIVEEKKRKTSARFSHPVSHLLGKVLHPKK